MFYVYQNSGDVGNDVKILKQKLKKFGYKAEDVKPNDDLSKKPSDHNTLFFLEANNSPGGEDFVWEYCFHKNQINSQAKYIFFSSKEDWMNKLRAAHGAQNVLFEVKPKHISLAAGLAAKPDEEKGNE